MAVKQTCTATPCMDNGRGLTPAHGKQELPSAVMPWPVRQPHTQLEVSRVGVRGDTQVAVPPGPSAGGLKHESWQSVPYLPAAQPPQLSPNARPGTAEVSNSPEELYM